MDSTSLQIASCLLLASFAGALLPLYRRWSDRGLHLLLSVSAGIFLGTIFLHLLPHLAGVGEADPDVHGLSGPAEHTLGPWIAALGGLLLLFAVEKVWLRSIAESAGANVHTGLWVATYVGLGLHSIAAGVGLAAILQQPDVGNQFLASILIHKATETFSLATVMRLANLKNARAFCFLFLFACLEPCGLLFGRELASSSVAVNSILTGFACGTFLYVAVCDLLPEVFHGVERPGLKLAAVVAGILASATTLPRLSMALELSEKLARESYSIFVDMAPYLLLGLVIAGVLNQWIKTDWLTRHLARDDLKSVSVASFVGAPLPLCSCSVVPVAVALRRAGASKGATVSFLIATPETGVDSVAVSWALLDPLLTIARPLGAIISAIFAGSLVNWFVRRGYDRQESAALAPEVTARAESSAACCAHEDGAAAVAAQPRVGDSTTSAQHAHVHTSQRSWPARVLRYGFVEILDDLAVSLIIGIVLSGLINVLVPAEVFETPLVHGFGGMLLMLVIGIPVYVCASASTPIAATLILKGLSPGAALVFLLAGPATNIGSLFILARELGKRVVIVQLVALSLVTLGLGLLVDRLYPLLGIAARASIGVAGFELPAWISLSCAALLALLILISLSRTRVSVDLFAKLRSEPKPSAR